MPFWYLAGGDSGKFKLYYGECLMSTFKNIVITADLNSATASQARLVLTEDSKSEMSKHNLKMTQSLNWTAYSNDNPEIQYKEFDPATKTMKVIDGSVLPTGTKVQVSMDIIPRVNPKPDSKNYASCVAIFVEANSYKPRQSETQRMDSISAMAIKAMSR